MLKKQLLWPVVGFLLTFGPSLYSQGRVWQFLSDAAIDGAQDHHKIPLGRPYGPYRAVQLRISGDAIFLQRMVVYYIDGTSEELVIGNRIFPEGRPRVIDFTGEPRVLESVELWYIAGAWQQRPRLILYGAR